MSGWRVRLWWSGAVALCAGLVVILAVVVHPEFTNSNTLTITTPPNLAPVRCTSGSCLSAPFTVRWTGGVSVPSRYAVFVDQTPLRPGENLRSLANSDNVCLHTPGCPNEAWFEAHFIYVTSHTSVRIPRLPIASNENGTSNSDQNVFRVTVIQVSESGNRIGEAFGAVTLRRVS